jgi:hypothetical protein
MCENGYCMASCTGCFTEEDEDFPCEDDCRERCSECLTCHVENDPCYKWCATDDDPFFCWNECGQC